MTRFEKDMRTIENDSAAGEEILRARKAEIERLTREWKTAKYRFRAETAYREAKRLKKEYDALEAMI